MQLDYVARLYKLFSSWLTSAGYKKNVEDILDHVIANRYLASQDKDLKIYLKEKGKLKLSELAQIAQSYLDAR